MIPRRSTALVALLLLLAGCSVSRVEEERPAPFFDRPAPSGTAPEVKVRRVEVGVPRWYDQPYVDFGDRSHGYALFASCGGKPPAPDCPALLYATENAGRSWHRVAHPRPFAQRQRLQVIFDVPALFVAGDGWYFSLDDGRSFRHERGAETPSIVRALRGPVQFDERIGKLIRWDAGVWRPVPVQVPLARPQSVHATGGFLVATGVAGGRPLLAVSFDAGATWRRPPLPTPDGEIATLRVMASVAGDLWLIGGRRDPARFPALWHFDGEWRPVVPADHPERFVSLVPVAQSRLAVTGPKGTGVVIAEGDGSYVDRLWPLHADHRLTVLPDGELLARGSEDLLLGGGDDWVRVVVERRRPPTDK